MKKNYAMLFGALMVSSSIFAQFPADYKGVPFNDSQTPWAVPGEFKAANFDALYDAGIEVDGQNVTYFDVATDNGNDAWNKSNTYRPAVKPTIEGGDETANIGFTSSGEWINYTIEVAEDGDYTIYTLACGPNGGGFHYNLDGVKATQSAQFTTKDWGDYQEFPVGIKLTAGKHILTWCCENGMNFKAIRIAKGKYNPENPFKNYEGVVFNGPHNIPGTIQGEDFDSGEDEGYHSGDGEDTELEGRGTVFRTEENVNIETVGEGNYALCWMRPSKWFNYTVYCTKAGTYDVIASVCMGTGSTGTLTLNIDGTLYTSDNYTGKGWGTYEIVSFPEKVELTEGKHVIQVTTGLNFDYMTFSDPTGINGVAAESNAAVKVYNLQGMELKAPVAGEVVIVKKDGKAFKTIAK